MSNYEPTAEDVQAYIDDCHKRDTGPYTLKTGDIYRGQEAVTAKQLRNGQWVVVYYGAIAFGMAEPIWRGKTREEAVKVADAFAMRQGWL